MKYEFVEVRKANTVDLTGDDMSMDVNMVLYAAVRPTDKAKDNQDSSVTSSTAATKKKHVRMCNNYIIY